MDLLLRNRAIPKRTNCHQSRRVAPFVMKPSGLYWRDLEGEASDLFLAGPFEILAETRDLDGCSWGLLLRWEDRDGRMKTWAMPNRFSRETASTSGERSSTAASRSE